MGFDGSGNYALSDTIAPATNCDANELQAILDDIAVAIDKCVVADGQSTITGTLKGADGTAALPAYTFASDLNSGFYRIGSDNIGLSLGGTKRIDFGTAGTVITGTFGVSSDFTASGISTHVGLATFGNVATPLTLYSADTGALQGPTLDLYRDSSGSAAVSDVIGGIDFNGRDSANNKQLYARIVGVIQDPISTTEDCSLFCQAAVAGATTTIWSTQGANFDVNADALIHGGATVTGAVSGGTAAGAMVATQAEQETGSATDKLVTPGRQHFHNSAAKMWGYVTGGSSPSLISSYNITSITDTATGRMVVTIGTDFSSGNWSAAIAIGGGTTNVFSVKISDGTQAAGSFELASCNGGGTLADPNAWHWQGFGDQ